MERLAPFASALPFCILAIIGCAPDENPVGPGSSEEITAPAFALASNSWVARANLPSGRHGLALGVAKNASGRDIVYAIGGYDTGDNHTNVANTVAAYDYTTNTWSNRAPMPAGLAHPNGVGNIGGKLYVSGGVREIANDNAENLRYLFVYDPLRNSWSRKADMPSATSDGVTGVISGKLYVATFGRLYRYTPSSNTWATLASSPYAHFAAAGGVINGKLYVAGGNASDGGGTGTQLHVYDPATNRWTAKAPMPTGRTWVAGAVLKNKLYIVGGRGATELRTVEAYDPATNKWTSKRPMPTAREQLDAAVFATPSGNPKILAVGGWEYRRVNELYTP